jgi:hypothetical protein
MYDEEILVTKFNSRLKEEIPTIPVFFTSKAAKPIVCRHVLALIMIEVNLFQHLYTNIGMA